MENNYGDPSEPVSRCETFGVNATLGTAEETVTSCRSCHDLVAVIRAFIFCTVSMYIMLPVLAHMEISKFAPPPNVSTKASACKRARTGCAQLCRACLEHVHFGHITTEQGGGLPENPRLGGNERWHVVGERSAAQLVRTSIFSVVNRALPDRRHHNIKFHVCRISRRRRGKYFNHGQNILRFRSLQQACR